MLLNFGLCFDVIAKYCKRLIKKEFLPEIMKKMILTNKNECIYISSRKAGYYWGVYKFIVNEGIRAI